MILWRVKGKSLQYPSHATSQEGLTFILKNEVFLGICLANILQC